jgi:fumarate hydratase, class II
VRPARRFCGIADPGNEPGSSIKAAALDLGYVTEAEFDRIVDPAKMVKPYVATGT